MSNETMERMFAEAQDALLPLCGAILTLHEKLSEIGRRMDTAAMTMPPGAEGAEELDRIGLAICRMRTSAGEMIRQIPEPVYQAWIARLRGAQPVLAADAETGERRPRTEDGPERAAMPLPEMACVEG